MSATFNPYLANNFAPVQTELTVDELPVLGELPLELNDRTSIENGLERYVRLDHLDPHSLKIKR